MTSWLNSLNDAWEELARTAPVARQYRNKLIATEVPLDILAGMRAVDDAPCLMLRTVLPPDAFFELGGMRLGTVPDASGPFLVLSLEDASRRDLFLTICADVVSAAAQSARAGALENFLARLDAWRQFLRDRRDGLSRIETVGLLGELLVLERLLADDPSCLPTWESPNDGLHDFARSGHALEVKCSIGPATKITVSKLDQLDTTGLRRLDLVHVRLVETPNGRCLRDVLAAVAGLLDNDVSRRAFDNALLRRGLMPDDENARTAPRVQMRDIESYGVVEGFPRLIRSGVPIAIADASYSLEVRALSAFAVDTSAVLREFAHGGADV